MILGVSTNYFKVLQILARRNADLQSFIKSMGEVAVETNKTMHERVVNLSEMKLRAQIPDTSRSMFPQSTIDAASRAATVARTMARTTNDEAERGE